MASGLNMRPGRGFVATVVGVVTVLGSAHGARAQVTLDVLHAFTREGDTPNGPVIQASDGNFYGTTERGGATNQGAIFKLTQAGVVTTLHSFDCNTDGCPPAGGLIEVEGGVLYGTTKGGSGPVTGGTVFRLTPAGAFTVLHTFNCATGGCGPSAGLIRAIDGDFYGTASGGGAANGGTVFKITSDGAFSALHSFDCRTEGCQPGAGLIQATDGNFYGTTATGGSANGGTAFKITPLGAFTAVHAFDCAPDGCQPSASLIQATDGNLYGVNLVGGTTNGGTIFKLTLAGAITTVHSFVCSADGCRPRGALLEADDGNFYGTTQEGGTTALGTAFKVTPAGTLTALYAFCGLQSVGCLATGGLIQASDHDFYGTTLGGGPLGDGAVFKITAAGAVAVVHPFGCGVDGCDPEGGLIQATDGNFYGTSRRGGAAFGGTVFKLTATGALTTLHSFDCSTEGCGPAACLIQASDGNLYGTTALGGTAGGGTVFTITPSGALTTLHSFDCSTEGCGPAAGLLQGIDGNFYGTTELGGPANGGTVFTITSAGALSALHSFDCSFEGRAGGCRPLASLIQGADNAFYGTTSEGGATSPGGEPGAGTVFKITSGGTLTTLHSFHCTEGCLPTASLIQASDGTFYGTAAGGGAALGGTVFNLTAAGVLTALHSFDCSTDDCGPRSSLIRGTDGSFYGTTLGAESGARGSIFRITPTGAFTTLRSFVCRTDGCQPVSRLLQGRDGTFYGTTTEDGPAGGGTLFRLSLGPAPILSALSPAKLWVGLQNNDAVGLKVDLLAEVFIATTKAGEGQLNNVSTGSSGFTNALLDTIPLALTGPAAVPAGAALTIKVSVRRTCTGTGHLAGAVRLWYNGQLVDNGANGDAGSRFGATIGDSPATSYFLRTGVALSRTAGTSKQSIDVAVDSKEPCPARTFKPFGSWSIVPQSSGEQRTDVDGAASRKTGPRREVTSSSATMMAMD